MPKADESIAMDLRFGNNIVSKKSEDAILQIGFASSNMNDYPYIPPVNICLVVDKSGSMSSDNRMEKLKIALKEFIEGLREDDIISIVVFDSDAEVILSAQKVGDTEKIKLLISNLSTGGNTNLNSGMILGYQEVMKNVNTYGTNKVILLTDGLTNTGETNTENIVNNSGEYNDKGINISTIGIGNNVNYNLLRQISNNGNGSNHFIGSSEDIQKVFIDELQSILFPVAKNVSLQIEYEKQLELINFYGYSPEYEKNTISLKLDNINCGLTQIVLIKFDTKNIISMGNAKVKVTLSYYDIREKKDNTITKTITITKQSNKKSDNLLDNEVRKNYSIAIMAQSLKDMAYYNEWGKEEEAKKVINDCKKEVEKNFPKTKDADILRVLQMVEKYILML